MPRRKQRTTFGGPSSVRRGLLSSMDTHSDEEPLMENAHSTSAHPHSFVEHWIQRSSTSDSIEPEGLRRRSSHSRRSFQQPREEVPDFGVGIPMDAVFDERGSDTESLKSKPSTRRSSMDSSIDDVFMPLDDENDNVRSEKWPDTVLLDEFAEKEKAELESAEAADLVRQSVDEAADAQQQGRLRPRYLVPWERPNVLQSQANMRFSYFRDDLRETVHSPTIGKLLQNNQKFADLFPQVESPQMHSNASVQEVNNSTPVLAPGSTPVPSMASQAPSIASDTNLVSPPWWLDINNPTEDELRVISRAFGIHPLTTEDILLHETREKVELFSNYYFVCFTSFDIKVNERVVPQSDENTKERSRRDSIGARSHNSSKLRRRRVERLKPLSVFSIVFKTGIITVHFRPTPHTINVRRRIRLLKEYLNVTADWISYALIDDITDGFQPLITAVDEDVQSIEDAILKMHGSQSDDEDEDSSKSVISSLSGSSSTGYREWREKGDMLRWIGESRKRVMSLLSLLSNKADVIKGFSKRVSEQWSGASRSEIAMYLGDIQDHLVTMTQNLNHYEKLLARSHSNYLAQLNIDMTKTNNDMNDVLSKISVLGTIVLPMNIVTGLWGMNVLVPGQESPTLVWFWGIVLMMFVFAISAYFVIMRFV